MSPSWLSPLSEELASVPIARQSGQPDIGLAKKLESGMVTLGPEILDLDRITADRKA